MFDESRIISAAKKGNIDAFDELIRKYAKEIYNLCYRLCGNFTEAEDLSQNVLLRAVQSIINFKQESSLSTWLHRIAVNLWIDTLRQQKNIKYIYIDDPVQLGDNEFKREFSDYKFIPEKDMENKELEEIIKKSLDILTSEQRVAIVLKYIEGKSLEEIAEICKCPIGTVSARLTRGIKVMRKLLKEHIE